MTADGKVLGWALHSPGSLIAARMVSFGPQSPPSDWLEQRIRRAAELRSALRLDSDAYRIVNSEGDFIPGLVVDRYAQTIVVSPHTRGIEALIDRIKDCLRSLFPGVSIYCRRDEHFARVESLSLQSGYLEGGGDGSAIIREGAARMKVDCAHGQKTGFYLDQRENRRIIAGSAADRVVLNLFSYTGAVALEAALAGASRVVSVETSRPAIEAARASAELNPGIPADRLEWVQEDVFSYLEHPCEYDMVIADPPPFARRRAELDGALKGYLSLFTQCMRGLPSGGLAFLFSCSGAVDRPTFRWVVAEAGLRAGRELRLLRELHADADHPAACNHPEGEYLKGWMIHAS